MHVKLTPVAKVMICCALIVTIYLIAGFLFIANVVDFGEYSAGIAMTFPYVAPYAIISEIIGVIGLICMHCDGDLTE